MVIIKNCKECELSSDSCNCVCLDLAAAPTQIVPTSTGSQRPAQYACPFCGRIALQSVCLECGTKSVLVAEHKDQSK